MDKLSTFDYLTPMGKKMRRVLTYLGIGLLLLVALVYAAVQIFTASIIERTVNKQLKEGVVLSLEGADISFFGGGLTMRGVHLSYTAADTAFWEVHVNQVHIATLGYKWTNEGNYVDVGAIHINQPEVAIRHGHKDFDLFKQKEDKNEGSAASTEMRIAALVIKAGELSYRSKAKDALRVSFSTDIHKLSSSAGSFAAEAWDANLSKLDWVFNDSLLAFKADSIQASGERRTFMCKGIHFTSLLGEDEFQRHFGVRKSRPDVSAEMLNLVWAEGARIDSIVVLRMDIEKPHVRLTRDNRLPMPDRVTSLPQAWLEGAGMMLRVDTIGIAQGAVEVELTGRKKGQKATLPFQTINGYLFGVQNIDPAKPAFTARLRATAMHETPVNLALRYDYGYNNPWNLVANLGGLDLTELSPILTNEVGITMGSGEMVSLRFVMEGNDDEGAGEVDFHYRNLHLEYPEDMQEERSKFKEFLVEAAATLFYRKDNPDKNTSTLGEFHVVRDKQKDFIGQWLDGLTEGMLHTVSKVNPGKARARRAQFHARRNMD